MKLEKNNKIKVVFFFKYEVILVNSFMQVQQMMKLEKNNKVQVIFFKYEVILDCFRLSARC